MMIHGSMVQIMIHYPKQSRHFLCRLPDYLIPYNRGNRILLCSGLIKIPIILTCGKEDCRLQIPLKFPVTEFITCLLPMWAAMVVPHLIRYMLSYCIVMLVSIPSFLRFLRANFQPVNK